MKDTEDERDDGMAIQATDFLVITDADSGEVLESRRGDPKKGIEKPNE